jgi:hypothetical protein
MMMAGFSYLISKRGLINAVNKWAPRVEHRMCARHIYANWRKKFTNKKYQKLF